jgi:4-hydroxybenzoyl-CoA thioesterase
LSFETTAIVRFGDVDPAGIVFYPRYFEMLSNAMEDWCARALGIDYHTMHQTQGLGIPTVAISATFAAPSMLGDVLTVRITPLKIGTSSCRVAADFSCEGEHRLSMDMTVVWMKLAERKSQPWPVGLRAMIEAEIVQGRRDPGKLENGG